MSSGPISPLYKARALCYNKKAWLHTEGYRSGHNGAVLKTVWRQRHKGSNPLPSGCMGEQFDIRAPKGFGYRMTSPVCICNKFIFDSCSKEQRIFEKYFLGEACS